MNQPANQQVDKQGKQLRVARTFDAPRELVYQMYSGDHIAKWWAPLPWVVADSKMDFRTGGTWHYAMQGPDGNKHYALMKFNEVTPPTHIAYEDAFADADGNVDPKLPVSTTVMDFIDRGGKTEVVMVTTYASEEALQTVLNMGMIEGMTIALNQLEALLAEAVANR